MNTSKFFEFLFENASQNSIIVMDVDGNILRANKAFANAFGYTEIEGKNFSLLFTAEDKKLNKPAKELQKVKSKGNANDDNYLVTKDGQQVWVSGESVLIKTSAEENYIVKVIQDIHAQKQLERFLIESSEFLESIFDSIKDRALLILDSMMHILKVNATFIEMFELDGPVQEESRLTDMNHAFWNNEALRREIRNFIVTNKQAEEKKFLLTTKSGDKKYVTLHGKILHVEPTLERKILIMIKEAGEEH
jgi:PAS domain S-box-containing protein